MDVSSGVLSGERLLMVLEHTAGNRAHGGHHRPAFPAGLPHRQRNVEYAGVPAGLRLQSWPAHGAGERLPSLVVDPVQENQDKRNGPARAGPYVLVERRAFALAWTAEAAIPT